MEFTSHRPGSFCWADLATSDTEGATEFYTQLFGWEAIKNPLPNGSTYTMLNLDGKSAAALYPLANEHFEMGVPPHWMSYVTTDDINALLEKITSVGGKVIMPPMNADEFGIGAMIQDPEGAMLGLWQPKAHIGTQVMHVHGSYSWFEYASHGSEETIPFYEKAFGYTAKTNDMGEMKYTTFYIEDQAISGLYTMPEDMKEIPPHWLLYFTVANLDASLELATSLGATVLMPKMAVPEIGFFSVIQDPQGAVFGLVEYGKM